MRIFLLFVMALAACSSRSNTPTVAKETPLLPRSVPRLVMNVVVTDSQIFRASNLGRVYRYGSGQMRRDVYIYPKASWSDPATQAKVFIQGLEMEKRRGRFDSYEVITNTPFNLTPADSVLSGHEVTLWIVRRHERQRSYFAVVSLPDSYLKFRISDRPDAPPQQRDFVSAWVKAYLGFKDD